MFLDIRLNWGQSHYILYIFQIQSCESICYYSRGKQKNAFNNFALGQLLHYYYSLQCCKYKWTASKWKITINFDMCWLSLSRCEIIITREIDFLFFLRKTTKRINVSEESFKNSVFHYIIFYVWSEENAMHNACWRLHSILMGFFLISNICYWKLGNVQTIINMFVQVYLKCRDKIKTLKKRIDRVRYLVFLYVFRMAMTVAFHTFHNEWQKRSSSFVIHLSIRYLLQTYIYKERQSIFLQFQC